MKKASNKVQKWMKKSIRFLLAFGFIGITSLLLTGCFSSWALSPRDKSIKEWEVQHRNPNEKSSDSILGSTKNTQKINDLNFKR